MGFIGGTFDLDMMCGVLMYFWKANIVQELWSSSSTVLVPTVLCALWASTWWVPVLLSGTY
jgi:hypothetical protein